MNILYDLSTPMVDSTQIHWSPLSFNFRWAIHVLSFSVVLIAFPQTLRASDWKYIGGTTYDGKYYYAFYDKQTEQQRDNGQYTAMWVKLVDYHTLDSTMKACHDTLVELAANRLASGRLPPSALQSDSSTMVLMLEIVANQFKPRTRYMMREELDCNKGKMRTVSLIVYDDFGDTVSSGSSPDAKWEEVVPDTFGEFMMKTICGQHR